MNESTAPILYFGSPDSNADMRHATGFSAPDPIVLLLEKDGMSLVVPDLEIGRLRKQLPGAFARTPGELGLKGAEQRNRGAWALALLKAKAVGEVRVPSSFPLGVARFLEEAGIELDTADPASLRKERAVKTRDEIEKIRAAQQAALSGMLRARELILGSEADSAGFLRRGRARLTSERVREEIRKAVLKHNCLDSGTIVAGGAQAADPHECGSGPLRAGEFVVVDIFPRHLETGYWGDMTRTFIKGEHSGRKRAMYAAVAKAQLRALGAIRQGVCGTAVHSLVEKTFDEEGFPTVVEDGAPRGFIHSTGHGVGLEIHEAPTLSRVPCTLLAGMVVTVEPGLYYKNLGGVRIEDTVIVTETGIEHLVQNEEI